MSAWDGRIHGRRHQSGESGDGEVAGRVKEHGSGGGSGEALVLGAHRASVMYMLWLSQ